MSKNEMLDLAGRYHPDFINHKNENDEWVCLPNSRSKPTMQTNAQQITHCRTRDNSRDKKACKSFAKDLIMKKESSNDLQSKMIKTIESYDLLIQGLNKNIKGFKVYPKLLTKPEHKHLHIIIDKVLFNALLNLDLITELKYLDISNALGNGFETNFFARITSHSCFEILDNVNRTVGKEIIELVKERLGVEALIGLNAHVKELNTIKKQHVESLKEIRNTLFGHRMNAGLKQAEQMMKINPKFIYDIGNRIFKIQINIQDTFVMKVLPEI